MKKIGTASEIHQTLRNTNFRIKKHYGQNFLGDQNILDNIIKKAEISKDVNVIEIGPGFGSLTEKIVEQANHVLAYEIDKELIPILKENFKGIKNLTIVNEDILKVNIDEDIKKHFNDDKKVVVISNLPYYITTPILMKFLETSYLTSKLVIMTQLEVAKRITSKPNTKDYNALSVVIQYRAFTNILFKVPKTVFIPMPNVDSAVISVELKQGEKSISIDEPFFFQFVHNTFTQRRKTLINNLLAAYPLIPRTVFEQIIESLNLSLTIRAEALDIPQLIQLSIAVQNKILQQKE